MREAVSLESGSDPLGGSPANRSRISNEWRGTAVLAVSTVTVGCYLAARSYAWADRIGMIEDKVTKYTIGTFIKGIKRTIVHEFCSRIPNAYAVRARPIHQ
ncbi:hypothetical protein GCM10028856_19270 [Halopiger thermotolerans]